MAPTSLTGGARKEMPIDEEAIPPFKAHQRPQQKPVIMTIARVLLEDALDLARLEEAAVPGRSGQEQAPDVGERVGLVPGAIGWGEPLLAAIENVVGKKTAHGLAEDPLSLSLPELEIGRDPCREVDEVVVQEGHARFDGVGHAQVIVHEEKPVEEGLEVEVEGAVEVRPP